MQYAELLHSKNLVQVPQVIVKIGNYEFGSFSKYNNHAKYPNYVQSLTVKKINGQVNTYTLQLQYLITEYSDPNFFEKVFSGVNQSRKIWFTYGDCAKEAFMYRQEEAIITSIDSSFSAESAAITYTVHAVSSAILATSGYYSFPARYEKPSTVLYETLENNSKYGLQDIFTGMRNANLFKTKGLIATNDRAVQLYAQENMSVLEYMQYLVDNMTSKADSGNIKKQDFYVLKYVDDTDPLFGGPRFEVVQVDAKQLHAEAYEINYGYPGDNLVRDLQVNNNQNYSIFYDYQKELHPQEYVSRITPTGEYEEVYAPILSSGNSQYMTRDVDKTWWTKVSEFPIKLSLVVKGLLRPAILMSYVKLNVIFFGKKHITSGLYIITAQEDSISESGVSTRLDLVRIGPDTEQGVFE